MRTDVSVLCRDALERARKELLDLSLRNRMLNYRPTKGRGVEILAQPKGVYQTIVEEEKAVTFLSAPEKVASSSLELVPYSRPRTLERPRSTAERDGLELASYLTFYDATLPQPPSQETDKSRLQTPYTDEKLQARLLGSYREARLSLSERGVHTLYLALGALQWYDSDDSSTPHRAPLILVPVALQRANVQQRFRLLYTRDGVVHNVSLAEKLRQFGVDAFPVPEENGGDVAAYFDEVARLIRNQPNWSVDRGAVFVDIFSYSKFPMYKDLDADSWPAHRQPHDHETLRALLSEDSFRSDGNAPRLPDDAFLDEHVQPEMSYGVADADSSQLRAIFEVGKGKNLVIQGPPGTGKSQTITNLLAEAVGTGKKVLFVSEKMAALEVVKRNLVGLGLGDLCLELHSHKTNKKALLESLEKTLNLGGTRADVHATLSLLAGKRAELNAYAEAVNTPIGKSGVTPHRAYGEVLKIQDVADTNDLPPLHLNGEGWSKDEFVEKRDLVQRLQNWCAENGAPTSHPFWGSGLRVLLPATETELRGLFTEAAGASSDLLTLTETLAASVGLQPPNYEAETARLCHAVLRLSNAPNVEGVALESDDWLERESDVQRLLSAGRYLSQTRRKYQHVLLSSAWEQPLEKTRRDLARYGSKWWRGLSGAYRKAAKTVAELHLGPPPKSPAARLLVVKDVVKAQQASKLFQAGSSLGEALFGSQWRGEDSDWGALSGIASWLKEVRLDKSENRLPSDFTALLSRKPDTSKRAEEVAAVERALDKHRRAVQTVFTRLSFDKKARFGSGTSEVGFLEQTHLFNLWEEQTSRLQATVTLNHLAESLEETELTPVFDLAASWEGAGEHLTHAFDSHWYNALLHLAFQERPALGFDRGAHENLVETFRELDALALKHNRSKLIARHRQDLRVSTSDPGYTLLRREMKKKRKHLPIRELMEKAGATVQRIKPIFMMSPTSVAQFLSPGSVDFDLVVFDEASQVRPADAFGAVLRGKQVVVVGDSKQLPPTSFFSHAAEDEDELESVNDLESILDLFDTQGAPSAMLRWHYRSRHESLIAVSNRHFYDDKLLIFPSPSRDGMGLSFHHLPDTLYDAGGSRTNQEEARAVAQRVMAHAREQPDRTLGVAAFSAAQMTAIEDALEVLRRQDPLGEAFFNAHPHEPFFVKNLETVQGDERDSIFVSVGYGRQRDGKLSMNFGPINKDGGWRRLNVIFTRARRRCEIFSNLSADDIDLSRTNSRGVKALQAFLAYAERGELDLPEVTDRGFDSPFEEAVYNKLTDLGYEVRPQVGVAGYFIDLAVVDPEHPGRYWLAVECDGASYHSARSARDRDRLREAVLKNRGWQVHRIWSTDWFRNPEARARAHRPGHPQGAHLCFATSF